MNKKIIIIFLCLLVVVGGVIAWLFSRSSNSLVESANFVGATTKKQNGSKVTLTTPSGDVVIKNIFQKKNTTYTQDGYPEITKISSTENYTFDYHYDGDFFVVYILKQPIAGVRAQAESAVLNSLGLSKEDACKLSNFNLHIPASLDKDYGGDEKFNYGLSWCPGAYVIE